MFACSSDDGELLAQTAAPPDGDGLRGLADRVARYRQAVGAVIDSRNGARFVHDTPEELGRDLTTRALQASRLIVADGAPGLISAVEELWPHADRQHCAVHRLRNLLAKLPDSERRRVRLAYG